MAEKQTNKERLKDITDSIETGIKELFESDRYRQYLATMSRFHKYSVNNTMGLLTPAPTHWPLPRTAPTICSAPWRSWTRTKTSSARRICSPGEPFGRTRP